jgi:hypothetical protein
LFGNRHHILITSLTRDSARRSALHASTLSVFLLGIVEQGFNPCRHHTSLDPSEHGGQPAVSTGAILSGMPQEDATTAGSESEYDDTFCSCLNVCDADSGDSFSLDHTYTQPISFAALNVVERPDTDLLDTRQNPYLIPLSRPPPHSS